MGKLIGAFACILALFFGCAWLLYDENLEKTEDAVASAGIFDTWTAPNGDTVIMVAGQKRMIDKKLVSAFSFAVSETVEMGRSLLPGFLEAGGEFLGNALSEISAVWEEATE